MKPGNSSTFIRRLRFERKRAGLSQTELARAMTERLKNRVDPTTITRMEQGARTVRLDDALAMADILGVPLMTLLSPTGSEHEARLDELRFELAIAESALNAAADEVEHRQERVNELRMAIEEIETTQQEQLDVEVNRELLDDLQAQQWPE